MCLVVLAMPNQNDVSRYSVLSDLTFLTTILVRITGRCWHPIVPVFIPQWIWQCRLPQLSFRKQPMKERFLQRQRFGGCRRCCVVLPILAHELHTIFIPRRLGRTNMHRCQPSKHGRGGRHSMPTPEHEQRGHGDGVFGCRLLSHRVGTLSLSQPDENVHTLMRTHAKPHKRICVACSCFSRGGVLRIAKVQDTGCNTTPRHTHALLSCFCFAFLLVSFSSKTNMA